MNRATELAGILRHMRDHLSLDDIQKGILRESAAHLDAKAAIDSAVTGDIEESRMQELIAARAVQVIAVANPQNFGFTAMAWLGIRTAPGADSASVARRLTSVGVLDYVVVPAGPWDLMAELVCRDQQEMASVIETQIGAMEGVRFVETFPYAGILYGSTTASWGVGRKV